MALRLGNGRRDLLDALPDVSRGARRGTIMQRGVYFTGNIVVDCLVRPVDELPEWGATAYVDSTDLHLGGNAAATAYATALMGVPATVAGAVGDDFFGEFALERLRGAGVDLARVRRKPDAATSTTVGLINREGERLFLHQPGASGLLALEDIPFDEEITTRHEYFHFGSIFCLPLLRPHSEELLNRARAAGLTTSLDTDWDVDDLWMEGFEPLCPLIDYLFANYDEARCLSGLSSPAAMGRFFRSRGVKVVVLKLGPEGCAVFSEDGDFTLPAYEVEVADTTGAGDCFCGAFLAGLCRGSDIEQAARLATAAAAHCVQQVGGTVGLNDFETTRRWMKSREPLKATNL